MTICKSCQEEPNEFCMVCLNSNKAADELNSLIEKTGYLSILNATIDLHPDLYTRSALKRALKNEAPQKIAQTAMDLDTLLRMFAGGMQPKQKPVDINIKNLIPPKNKS